MEKKDNAIRDFLLNGSDHLDGKQSLDGKRPDPSKNDGADDEIMTSAYHTLPEQQL